MLKQNVRKALYFDSLYTVKCVHLFNLKKLLFELYLFTKKSNKQLFISNYAFS